MSNKYELEGQIKVINSTQTFDSGFSKREFVITTEDKYPQDVKFETIKDGCDKLDDYNVGDNVIVSFNVRGNEYNDKYYVNLQAWKMEHVEGKQTVAEAEKEAAVATAEAHANSQSDSSNLPF